MTAVLEKTKDNELYTSSVLIPAPGDVNYSITLESADEGGILDIIYIGYGSSDEITCGRYIQCFWLLSNSLSSISTILNSTNSEESETFTISLSAKGSANKVLINLAVGGETSAESRGVMYVRGYLKNGHIYNLQLDT